MKSRSAREDDWRPDFRCLQAIRVFFKILWVLLQGNWLARVNQVNEFSIITLKVRWQMKSLMAAFGLVLTIAFLAGQEERIEQEKTEPSNVNIAAADAVALPNEAGDDKVFVDFREAVDEANRTGKPIFIYVFDST